MVGKMYENNFTLYIRHVFGRYGLGASLSLIGFLCSCYGYLVYLCCEQLAT